MLTWLCEQENAVLMVFNNYCHVLRFITKVHEGRKELKRAACVPVLACSFWNDHVFFLRGAEGKNMVKNIMWRGPITLTKRKSSYGRCLILGQSRPSKISSSTAWRLSKELSKTSRSISNTQLNQDQPVTIAGPVAAAAPARWRAAQGAGAAGAPATAADPAPKWSRPDPGAPLRQRRAQGRRRPQTLGPSHQPPALPTGPRTGGAPRRRGAPSRAPGGPSSTLTAANGRRPQPLQHGRGHSPTSGPAREG
jgi:hypothetical protein